MTTVLVYGYCNKQSRQETSQDKGSLWLIVLKALVYLLACGTGTSHGRSRDRIKLLTPRQESGREEATGAVLSLGRTCSNGLERPLYGVTLGSSL